MSHLSVLKLLLNNLTAGEGRETLSPTTVERPSWSESRRLHGTVNHTAELLESHFHEDREPVPIFTFVCAYASCLVHQRTHFP
jgi:hypothetical protein